MAYVTTQFVQFFKYHFYDLKMTFGYTGIYTNILRMKVAFFAKQYGCFTAFLEITIATKRLISPERKGSNFIRFT